jgi:hypothetical protein
MNEVEQLREWIKNDHTTSSLAKSMGISYDGVYQALNVRGVHGYLSAEFKWRFLLTFGADEALAIFDIESVAAPA